MYTKFQLFAENTSIIDTLKLIIENPTNEQQFWIKLSDNQFTMTEECHLLQYLEKELLSTDDSIKGLLLSLAGGIYVFSLNPHQDIQKGRRYIEEAVILNTVPAMVNLGNMYLMGIGVPKNAMQAKALYEQGVEFNNELAMFKLGMMYNTGVDIPQNLDKAAFFFRMAYVLSNKLAESELKYLKKQYASHHTIQYHCVMAIEPQAINTLAKTSPHAIGNCILNDELLTDKEKYQLFQSILNNPNFAKYTSAEVKRFIADSIKFETKEATSLATQLSPQNAEYKKLLNQDNLNSTLSMVKSALKQIDHGADINTQNTKGDTLLHIVLKNKVWLALNSKDDLTIHWISGVIQQMILHYEIDFDTKNNDGLTPFQSVMEDSSDINWGYKLMLLIDYGFDPHTLDKKGNSLLHLYAKTGQPQTLTYITKLIEEYQLDINLKNNFGYTPLRCLIESGHFSQSFADMLISLGADLKPIELYYQTPEQMIQFDVALKNLNENAAIEFFCRMNRIKNTSNPGDPILSRICALIKWPVNTVCIVKLIKYEANIANIIKANNPLNPLLSKNRSYFKTLINDAFTKLDDKNTYLMSRIAINFGSLLSVKQFISDWDAVENSFEWSSSELITAIYYCEPQNAFVIKELGKLLESTIEKERLGSKPLAAIITNICSRISGLNRSDHALQQLNILLDVVKKITSYKSDYISKHGNIKKDMYLLNEILTNPNVESALRFNPKQISEINDKISEITQLVKTTKIKLHAFHFFCNPASLFSQLPGEIKSIVLTMQAKTL